MEVLPAQPHPDRGMIARVLLAAHVAIDPGILQSLGEQRAQQNMIEPQAGVALPPVPHVVPEGVDALVGMERAQRVGPALLDKAGIGGAALGLHQRVVIP